MKSPARVAAGRRNVEKRWGPAGTRTIKIGDLTLEQRQYVVHVIEAFRRGQQPESRYCYHEVTCGNHEAIRDELRVILDKWAAVDK